MDNFDKVMEMFTVNAMLLNISLDESYNEEVRKLAKELISIKCDPNAKKALIEECICRTNE